MNRRIEKSFLKGEIVAEPSKSYFHRYLLSSFLAGGTSEISYVSDLSCSKDILATLSCASLFHKKAEILGKTLRISPVSSEPEKIATNCFESGSTLRFLIPVVLALYGSGEFYGTERLIQRGIGIYQDIFEQNGIRTKPYKDHFEIEGTLRSGEYLIPGNVSSQFVTGLLFALPLLKGDSVLKVVPPFYSRNYVDITLDVLAQAGIRIQRNGDTFFIPGNQEYRARAYELEGDYSNAAFFAALGELSGNSIQILGLKKDSKQGDRVYTELFKKLKEGFAQIDLENCIDLGPILFTFASMHSGGDFTGIRRLRIKESDRASDLLAELSKAGCAYSFVSDDEVKIYPLDLTKENLTFSSHNDHRLAMALSVLLTRNGGTLTNAEAVNKSYPSFFEELKRLGGKVS